MPRDGRPRRRWSRRGRQIAAGIGTAARNVTFTSGATEAANLALTPMVQRGKRLGPDGGLAAGGGRASGRASGASLSGRRGRARRAHAGGRSLAGRARRGAGAPRRQARHARASGRKQRDGRDSAGPRGGGAGPCGGRARRLRRDPGDWPDRDDIPDNRIRFSVLFLTQARRTGRAPGRLPLRGTISTYHGDAPARRRTGMRTPRGDRECRRESPASPRLSRRRWRGGGRRSRGSAALRDRIERKVARNRPGRRGSSAGRAACRRRSSAFAHSGASGAYAVDGAGPCGRRRRPAARPARPARCASSMCWPPWALQEKEALRVSLGWSTSEEDVEQFGIVLAEVVDRIRSRRSVA